MSLKEKTKIRCKKCV